MLSRDLNQILISRDSNQRPNELCNAFTNGAMLAIICDKLCPRQTLSTTNFVYEKNIVSEKNIDYEKTLSKKKHCLYEKNIVYEKILTVDAQHSLKHHGSFVK